MYVIYCQWVVWNEVELEWGGIYNLYSNCFVKSLSEHKKIQMQKYLYLWGRRYVQIISFSICYLKH